jgi:hypothetical protein
MNRAYSGDCACGAIRYEAQRNRSFTIPVNSATASREIGAPIARGLQLFSCPMQLKRLRLFATGCHLYLLLFNNCYWPAAGDTTLGLASVLLLFGALVPEFAPLFVLLGRPEFGNLAAVPLSELLTPGVP